MKKPANADNFLLWFGYVDFLLQLPSSANERLYHSRTDVIYVVCLPPNWSLARKKQRNLADTSLSTETSVSSVTSSYPDVITPYRSSDHLLLIAVPLTPNMVSTFDVCDPTKLVLPTRCIIYPMAVRCYGSAGGSKNTSSPLC